MKSKFTGYYKPTEVEFKELWENALFVLDTNVLLDLFRYSENAVNALFKAIETLKDRIWIPYKVAFEYHKDLNSVISAQAKNIESLLNNNPLKEKIATLFEKKLVMNLNNLFLMQFIRMERNAIQKNVLLDIWMLKTRKG
ncbi:hypothetical protein Barb4_00031 [Bacteroidales bacterium Barb4]|nr:hypothetical protein Barb4_00031 [Bacteroidales bacterium Barb4]